MELSVAFCPVCGVALEKASARKCKVCGADIQATRAREAAEDANSAFAPSAIDREDTSELPEKPPLHPKLGETVSGYLNIGDTSAGTVILNWQRQGWVLDSKNASGDGIWDMNFRFDPEEAAARSRRAKRIGLAVAATFLLAIAGIGFAIFLGSA